jgi:uncharacterized membrane protein
MRTLYLASVGLHILAATTWIGGMVVFIAAIGPTTRQVADVHTGAFMRTFMAHFRTVMWIALGLAGASGVAILAARGLRVADVTSAEWLASPFGRTVSIKAAIFLFSVGLTLAHEQLRTKWRARWMGRLLFVLALAAASCGIVLVRGV